MGFRGDIVYVRKARSHRHKRRLCREARHSRRTLGTLVDSAADISFLGRFLIGFARRHSVRSKKVSLFRPFSLLRAESIPCEWATRWGTCPRPLISQVKSTSTTSLINDHVLVRSFGWVSVSFGLGQITRSPTGRRGPTVHKQSRFFIIRVEWISCFVIDDQFWFVCSVKDPLGSAWSHGAWTWSNHSISS